MSGKGRIANKLTVKQKAFCENFAASGNALQSAIKAGYSKTSAHATADKMLKKAYVHDYLKSLTTKLEDKRFATLEEVQAYWTDVLRNEEPKYALKASEFIARTKGAFIERVEHSTRSDTPLSVQIVMPQLKPKK